MRKLVTKRNLSIIVLCLIVALVSSFITYAATPTGIITLSSGVYPGAPSYTVYQVAGVTYAKDQNGYNEFSGTNAGAIIQEALNTLGTAGGRILVTAGQYELTSPILINRSFVSLVGEGFGFGSGSTGANKGEGVTVLYSNSAIDLIQVNGSGTKLHGIEICNLNLYGSGKTNGYAGINTFETDQMHISNIFAANNQYGFYVSRDDASYIRDCTMLWNGYGIYITAGGYITNYLKVTTCEISDNDNYGVWLSATHCLIQGCTLVRNGHNIYFYSGIGNRIISNVVGLTSTEAGIELRSQEHIIVSENQIFSSGDHGITAFTNCLDGLITENNIYNPSQRGANSGSGIVIQDSSNMTVSNNVVSGDNVTPYKFGIEEKGTADYNLISVNKIVSGYASGAIQKLGANTIVQNNAGYLTENSATATNTTATTFVFNHGLASTATGVWCSFSSLAITGYTWTSTTTQVTVTVTGTLPSSWTTYAKVEYQP